MADLIIRGMEVPTNHDVTIRIDLNGEVYVYNTYPTLLLRAVTLPEGHGRLIDADKMRESIRRQAGLLKLMGGEFAEIAETLEKGFLQEIDNAPTIVPAEGGNADG